jgi:hypothetical protein
MSKKNALSHHVLLHALKFPVAHRSTIFTTTKNRERKREKKNRKEMDAIDSVFDPLREFSKDSVRLVKRCHKPDRKG